MRRTVTRDKCNIATACEECGQRIEIGSLVVIVGFPAVRARPARTYYLHETCCQREYPSCWEQLQEGR